jgi:hypothetical protein
LIHRRRRGRAGHPHYIRREYDPPAEDPGEGYLDWRLVTGNKRPLASGMYVFSVESQYGTEFGKFVVIR